VRADGPAFDEDDLALLDDAFEADRDVRERIPEHPEKPHHVNPFSVMLRPELFGIVAVERRDLPCASHPLPLPSSAPFLLDRPRGPRLHDEHRSSVDPTYMAGGRGGSHPACRYGGLAGPSHVARRHVPCDCLLRK
jgi:hypothetical protein